MILKFLGSGSAFTMNNYQTNMILMKGNRKFLIDAGSDIRFSLRDANLSYKDITDVYIAHLHADHAGGLEYLAFCTFFDPACSKPNLWISKALSESLWQNVLSGGLGSIQNRIMKLNDYFDVKEIDQNESIYWNDIKMTPIQVVHIMDGFNIRPSFGLMINRGNKKIFITTDTQFNPNQIVDFYKSADLIFQDCETTAFKSGVHANYSELLTLPNEIKKKMWLCHYQEKSAWMTTKKDGFKGFVLQGQEFKI